MMSTRRSGGPDAPGSAVNVALPPGTADAGWLRATERMLGEPIRREVIEGFEGERIDTRPPKPRGGRPNGARKPGGSRQKPGASRNASRRKPGTKAKKEGGDDGRPSRRPRSGERSRARSRGGRS